MTYTMVCSKRDGKFYVFDMEVPESVWCEASAMAYRKTPHMKIKKLVMERIGSKSSAQNKVTKADTNTKKAKKEHKDG